MRAAWTIDTYAAHNEALRSAEEKFQQERDRRYAEVKSAEEKALLVKDRADRDALDLARQIQTYKDEKANELREQIAAERGSYATKDDLLALGEKFEAMHRPVVEFMAQQMGRGTGALDQRALIGWIVAVIATLITLGAFVFDQRTPPTLAMPAPSSASPQK